MRTIVDLSEINKPFCIQDDKVQAAFKTVVRPYSEALAPPAFGHVQNDEAPKSCLLCNQVCLLLV